MYRAGYGIVVNKKDNAWDWVILFVRLILETSETVYTVSNLQYVKDSIHLRLWQELCS